MGSNNTLFWACNRPYMVEVPQVPSPLSSMDEYNQWLSTQSSPSRHDKL
ncbi:hypothetical protein OROMI_006213 [Orobanche minor]